MRAFFLCAALLGNAALADVPSGWWITGPDAQYFRADLDTAVKHRGHSSARLSSIATKGIPIGFLCQRINLRSFAGSRVRLSACVKTKTADAAGLLLRLHEGARPPANDHMQGPQLEKDSEWTLLEQVFDVPKEPSELAYGV